VRKIAPDGTVTTFSGSGDNWVCGHKDGRGAEAKFDGPCGVAVDGEGNIVVADQKNHRVRQIAPDGEAPRRSSSGRAALLWTARATSSSQTLETTACARWLRTAG
jgi:hypothetical protein